MITSLKENQCFVFGSNKLGNHAGGAARQAHEQFGAEMGVGEGMTGQCYAFPTLDENMQKVSEESLKKSIELFYAWANDNPQVEFLLTAVGTGIAGFETEYIRGLFGELPANVKRV